MEDKVTAKLEQLGLSPVEAQVYLALTQNGPLGASAVAVATGFARTSVYPTLGALVDKGLVDVGEGYGRRFSAVPAERALPQLLVSEKESLVQRERLTAEVVEQISSLMDKEETIPEELVQVIRSPRAVAERFERLQFEAEQGIDIIIKAPFVNRSGNSAQDKALRRGVHARSLYEKAALDDPAVRPFLTKWLTTGEEARIYNGELPHKLAIFDKEVVLIPLSMPGAQTRTLFIKHKRLAQGLGIMFDFFWTQAEPIDSGGPEKLPTKRTSSPQQAKRVLAPKSASVASRHRKNSRKR